jgi:hypothetical protein
MNTRKRSTGRHQARHPGRGWLVGGAATLLIATGGYYASAQDIPLGMAVGPGSTATTHATIHAGGLTGQLTTTTTQPPGAQGQPLTAWTTRESPVRPATPAARQTPAHATPPVPATTAGSPATPVTAAPARPAVVYARPAPGPTVAQITRFLAHYRFEHWTGWEIDGLIRAPNGHDGTLTAVVADAVQTANGGVETIFVWNNQQFLGVTTTELTYQPTLQALPGNGFTVTYYQWPRSMPFALQEPNDASRHQTVAYRWTGTRLVASYTGPILSPIPAPSEPGSPVTRPPASVALPPAPAGTEYVQYTVPPAPAFQHPGEIHYLYLLVPQGSRWFSTSGDATWHLPSVSFSQGPTISVGGGPGTITQALTFTCPRCDGSSFLPTSEPGWQTATVAGRTLYWTHNLSGTLSATSAVVNEQLYIADGEATLIVSFILSYNPQVTSLDQALAEVRLLRDGVQWTTFPQ